MLTMEEMLAKFIDEWKREHEEMEIFIKEFKTTNELLLKEQSNLLSELKIEVNELSKVMSNVLIPKYEVNGVTTRGGKMTFEASHSKEINETGINKNEPPRFEQDVQEKPHDVVKNKSLSIRERTTQPLINHNNHLYLSQTRLEEACTETMNERCSAILLKKLPSKEKDPRSFTTPCQVLEKHKEVEDLAANHLSRFENPHMEVLTEREIDDKYSDEHLMVLKSKFNNDEPWYADFVNYIVRNVVLPNWTFEKRKRFFSQVKTYFWEEPYAFKLCAYNIMRRYVAGSETLKILPHCHSRPIGGHHSVNVTAKKSRLMQLNELAELRDGAYENTRIYKERTKKCHDSRLRGDKDFKVGDKNGCNFKVNGQRLKKYYEGDIDKEDAEVIEFENGVT
ncbi:hypothetical protein Tco_1284248 [Tanacetum coccineum]